MSSLVKILVTALFGLLLIGLAMVNRSDVPFSIPFFLNDLPVPLAIIILNSVSVGFIWGACIVWLNGSATRKEIRQLRREIKAVEDDTKK